MKKLLVFCLTLCLLCGAYASAEKSNTITQDLGTTDTIVKYTILPCEEFTVTIPSNVTLTQENSLGADMTISLSAPKFNVKDKKITVALTNAAFKLVNGSYEIPYTISPKEGNSAYQKNSAVLEWRSGSTDTTASQALHIAAQMQSLNNLPAGIYSDCLTFTVTVANTAVNTDGIAQIN